VLFCKQPQLLACPLFMFRALIIFTFPQSQRHNHFTMHLAPISAGSIRVRKLNLLPGICNDFSIFVPFPQIKTLGLCAVENRHGITAHEDRGHFTY
jgi:hypothetical protein